MNQIKCQLCNNKGAKVTFQNVEQEGLYAVRKTTYKCQICRTVFQKSKKMGIVDDDGDEC